MNIFEHLQSADLSNPNDKHTTEIQKEIDKALSNELDNAQVLHLSKVCSFFLYRLYTQQYRKKSEVSFEPEENSSFSVPPTLEKLLQIPQIDLSYTCTETKEDVKKTKSKRTLSRSGLIKSLRMKNEIYKRQGSSRRNIPQENKFVVKVFNIALKFKPNGIDSESLFMILDPKMINFLPFYFKNKKFISCLQSIDQKVKTHALRSCFSLPKSRGRKKSRILQIRDSYTAMAGFSGSNVLDGDKVFLKVLELDLNGHMLKKEHIPKFCYFVLNLFKRDQIKMSPEIFSAEEGNYFEDVQRDRAYDISCDLDEDEFEPLFDDEPDEDKNAFRIDHVQSVLPLLKDQFKRDGDRHRLRILRTFTFLQEEDPQFIQAVKKIFNKYLALHKKSFQTGRKTNYSNYSRGTSVNDRTRVSKYSRFHKRSMSSEGGEDYDIVPQTQMVGRIKKNKVFDIDELGLFNKVLGSSLSLMKVSSTTRKSIWLFSREDFDLSEVHVQKMMSVLFHPELREFCSRGGFEILQVLYWVERKIPKLDNWISIIQASGDSELQSHFGKIFLVDEI
eukprot:snap_masked-scaffold_55-processed-gene-0.23-mRNA-1 protein AED:1.00 eAED:1.00 QI:0/-1/0/0/-1/1/1/0/557